MCSTSSSRNLLHATSIKTMDLQRLKLEKMTGHQSVRCRGGVFAVMYETHGMGLSLPFW